MKLLHQSWKEQNLIVAADWERLLLQSHWGTHSSSLFLCSQERDHPVLQSKAPQSHPAHQLTAVAVLAAAAGVVLAGPAAAVVGVVAALPLPAVAGVVAVLLLPPVVPAAAASMPPAVLLFVVPPAAASIVPLAAATVPPAVVSKVVVGAIALPVLEPVALEGAAAAVPAVKQPFVVFPFLAALSPSSEEQPC